MREREREEGGGGKILIGGFCSRHTRCNLERDKERTKESRGEDAREERLCPIPSSNPVSVNPKHG